VTTGNKALRLYPYGTDLLEVTARRVLEHCQERLPDLTQAVILVPDPDIAPTLRRALLEQAGQRAALLGPQIVPLRTWITRCCPDKDPTLSPPARELLFVESIRDHTHLFGDEDPWRISESLLTLFDELTLNKLVLPGSAEAFTDRLRRAYGMSVTSLSGLTREARMIHTLWRAWHDQLATERMLDPALAYVAHLEDIAAQTRAAGFIYLVGHHDLAASEARWFEEMVSRGRIEWITHGRPGGVGIRPEATLRRALEICPEPWVSPDEDGAAAQCLDAVFAGSAAADLATRARSLARVWPESPLSSRLQVFAAGNAEREAQAVELQIRRWLLADGSRRLGIVTEDRRLARRIRALLERAGIELQDNGGWALSTTSAAAALERWLETVEEDFAYQPLLDLLKSAFVFPDDPAESRLSSVYRLEQDIVFHEQIARGLDRFRRHIDYRHRRLPWPCEETPRRLHDLLDRLDEAAAPLHELRGHSHAARLCLARLRQSMESLGMWAAFGADPAGQRILQIWEDLDAAARHCPLPLDWLEFRAWLGRALERHTFRPVRRSAPVQLLTLSQSRAHRFDGLVIAGCDQAGLPGPPPSSPYFNDGVRHELGLPGRDEQLTSRLHDFRRLLEAAPAVLLTWRKEDLGEPNLPSPWVERLTSFHEFAYQAGLDATELGEILGQPGSQVASNFPLLPPSETLAPRPRLSTGLRPRVLSASAYQQLVDCPYQFYAAYCLNLQAPEPVREALQKSDYGQRVHRCLQAFHADVPGLPGPFQERVAQSNRDMAVKLLEDISQAVFARDLEDNFEHRGWLKRWLAQIPGYVDWEIRRESHWQVAAVERSAQQEINAGLEVRGRLDRIDRHQEALAIVDYKTGSAASQDAVATGEDVQLALYAALTKGGAVRVEYLLLDSKPVKSGALLEGDALALLSQQNRRRLEQIVADIDAGAPLPAWGDDRTCRYCAMDGICRKQAWSDAGDTVPT
jgi:ATP-dependent helicase/nuclease subunit B